MARTTWYDRHIEFFEPALRKGNSKVLAASGVSIKPDYPASIPDNSA